MLDTKSIYCIIPLIWSSRTGKHSSIYFYGKGSKNRDCLIQGRNWRQTGKDMRELPGMIAMYPSKIFPDFPGGLWLGICLPMQGTPVWFWPRKTQHGSGQLSPYTTTAEPVHCNDWSPHTLEPVLCNKRSNHKENPTHHN